MISATAYVLLLAGLEVLIFVGALANMILAIPLWQQMRGLKARAWQLLILGFMAFFAAEATRLSSMLGMELEFFTELLELTTSLLLVAGLFLAVKSVSGSEEQRENEEAVSQPD